MSVKRYDLSQIEVFQRDLKEQMRGALVSGIQQAAERTRTHVQEVIEGTDPKPVFRGYYRVFWMVDKLPGGAIIRNSLPYAVVIEEGAKPNRIHPGYKLLEELRYWVRIKLGVAEEDTHHVAWAIAKKLEKNGLPAKKVFETALKKVPELIQQCCVAELNKLGKKSK